MAKGDDDSEPKQEEIFSTSSFSSLGLHPTLCSHLQEKLGFEAPTLIQAQAIPVILSGRHVLVSAATGTGKTVTYLAPIIHHLQSYSPKIDRSNGTLALVLVPTRELCLQVYEILTKMLQRFIWIVPGYVMGGENRAKEKARLRKGISILVATPGRLLDHLKNTSSFIHTNLRWIIFDEADRILELGYGKEIEEILVILGSRRSSNRQNVLLSATLNEKVNHLANISLDDPISIGLDSKSHFLKPDSICEYESEVNATEISPHVDDYKLPTQLMQRYVKVPCSARLAVLLSLLHHRFTKKGPQKTVVFFSTCDAVDFHYSLFCEFHHNSEQHEQEKPYLGCKTFKLHGNMAQEDRKSNFTAFKASKLGLLLCTDVAARGLDFPQVKCIIQYDSPGEATEYVHRVGRTARLGEKGESLLFLQPIEMDYLTDLAKHSVKLSEFPVTKVLNSGSLQARKFCALDLHPFVLSIQKALEALVLSKMEMNTLAQKAFCSWVRAYTAHRGELKRIFMVKKLHLGHVAKSFALKQTPSLVGKSHMKLLKRKRDNKNLGQFKKRRKLHVAA